MFTAKLYASEDLSCSLNDFSKQIRFANSSEMDIKISIGDFLTSSLNVVPVTWIQNRLCGRLSARGSCGCLVTGTNC